MHFSNSNPICHAFDAEAKDGHDLLIGLNSGDGKYTFSMNDLCSMFLDEVMKLCLNDSLSMQIVVYSVSLRLQLQDVGKKLVGAQHYNKEGSVNNRQEY